MKQKTAFFLCFVCIFCTSLPGFTEGFQLVDKKDMKLLLNLRFAFLGSVDIPENAVDVSISSAGMAIRSELYKWLDFTISFDVPPSDNMADYDYSFILKDLYIRHDFHDYFGFRAGRFKVPFGEELFYSLGERPYMQRINTTRGIPRAVTWELWYPEVN